MADNLESMSRADLMKLRNEIDRALETLEARKKKAALEAAEKAAKEHGFSLTDILDGKARKGKSGGKSAAPAKYRNPADEGQTWSGRGRQPGWFKSALAEGKSPESLEV